MLALDAYYRKYISDPNQLIDHFIFVSNFSRKKHVQFNANYNLKSSMLYNFRPGGFSRSRVRGKYLLYYGRLSSEKGIELLVEAIKEIKINLKIVGSGPLEDKLRCIKNSQIEILGYRSGKHLWNLIENCSFVIVPSLLYENNPLSIVESFSIGKPVIASDIGGITELLQDGRGFLVEPNNQGAITIAINDAVSLSDEAYHQMSSRAFEYALNNFSPESHYKSLINIYSNISDAKKAYE